MLGFRTGAGLGRLTGSVAVKPAQFVSRYRAGWRANVFVERLWRSIFVQQRFGLTDEPCKNSPLDRSAQPGELCPNRHQLA